MPAQSLPPDVLHLVLDHVTVSDLFTVTRVSRLWRATGYGHPKYWKWLDISDRSCTPGGVALFSQRLHAGPASATINLELSLSSPPKDLALLLLSSLRLHIHRTGHITLALSAHVAMVFRDLFLCSAPFLQELCVIITSYDARLESLCCMFNLHRQTRLEHVTLIDVPLGPGLLPVSQGLKTLTVFYFDCPPCVQHAVSWLPEAEMLVIASPRQTLTSAGSLPAMSSLRHLSLLCDNWYHVIRSLCPSSQLATIGVGSPYPVPVDAADILPASDAVCMCIKTQLPQDPRIGQTQWGAVAISTPDRALTRLFHHIDISYMVSERFLGRLIPFDRLVRLVVSLSCGFTDICIGGYAFPRLDTLCLGIGYIYDTLGNWEWGSVDCPVLRTLAFQKESEARPIIRARDAQQFVDRALKRAQPSRLRIVLRDVVMDGSWPTSNCEATIAHQLPRVHWLHDSGMDWSDDVPIRTDWMDID